MEKKLTDEEIVKALECMAGKVQRDCDKCAFMIDKFCSDTELSTATLDLIHRLQSENEKLTAFKNEAISMSLYGKGRKDGEDVAKMELEQQKAAIERLTEERDKAKRDNTSLIYNISRVEKENDELQKQVEELKIYLASEKVCSKQVKAENAELQKQVDELEQELEKAYETERANIQAEIAEAGASCHWCQAQAVKDTAKEILDKAIIIDKNTGNNGFICIEALTELCKSKGVEVE